VIVRKLKEVALEYKKWPGRHFLALLGFKKPLKSLKFFFSKKIIFYRQKNCFQSQKNVEKTLIFRVFF